MIVCGDLPPEPVKLTIKADLSQFTAAVETARVATDDFVRYMVTTARQLLVLDLKLEVLGLNADQVWARFYTRGAMHPDFADESAVDHYLRALTRIDGDRGHAARTGFLQGWADHRAGNDPVRLLPWHRLLGDRAVTVGRAA